MSGYRLLPETEHKIVEIGARSGQTAIMMAYLTRSQRLWRSPRLGGQSPRNMGVDGYACRYERHLIYWRMLDDGRVGIVTVLHERMHQIPQVRDAFND
jgi:plasmid stabilization system protein ParE